MGWVRRAAGAVALSSAAGLAGIVGAPPAAAAAAQLTRAPYLTDVVGSVATVNWGTDSAGTATVTYGPVAASCTGATATGAATAITVATRAEEQWTAQLTGLSPATAYCYQITQDGTALLTSTPHFPSAVAAGTTGPFSFAVLGDWGEATNGVNTDQQKVLEQVAKSGVQFALGTGDIGYGDASQTDYGDLQNTGGNSEVFRSGFWGEPGGSVPMFTAIGNHGWNDTFLQNWPQPTAVSSSSGAYSLDGSGNPQAWYAFDEGPARFYVLEAAAATAGTQYADDDNLHWTSNSPQLTWLKNDLASHPGTLKVAVFHYPLWSDDSTNSDALLRRDLLPTLDQYGVRLVFNGHSHIYERNNPYTDGTVNGLISYVSGGAGADTEDVTQCSAFDAYALGWATSGTSCHATAPTSASQVHHFLKVTVNASTVTVAPTDENGNVFDQQTYDFAPGAPTGLTATAGSSHVGLSWTAPASDGGSAVSGYTVYRSTSPTAAGTAIASDIATTSYDDTTAAAATTYYYWVRATNAAGLTGPLSSQGSATPYAAPGAPEAVTATPANGAVSLSWTAPSSNGSAISGYTVYQSTTNGTRGTAVGNPTGTTFDDTGLTNGTTYYYTVTATNAVGEGPDSTQTSATPHAVPAAPTGLTASPGNGSVSLTWTAPPSNGSAISGYTVYQSTTNGTRGTAVGNPTGTTFDDTGLTNGTTYFYTVTAVNAAGEGPGVQVSSAPRTKPTAPTNLTATGQNTAVALTWSAPSNDGGAAISGYTVYRSMTSGVRGSSIAHPTDTTFTDTGRTNGTTYYYTVTAANAAGDGPDSSQVSATPRTVPDAPTGVSAAPGNGSVALTWSVPAGNGSSITGYTVYRSTDTTTWSQVGTTATTGFSDGGLANGTTYYYAVTATNAAGESARSAIASALPATRPAAPSSLTATAADGHVDLSWTAPADTGGRPVAGYTVYRSTTTGSLGAPITSTTATSLTDNDVHDGTTYYYAVTASNAVGEGPASAAVTARPHGGATVTITGRPSSPTTSTTATLTFATTDPNGLAPTTTCRLDAGSASACTSGQTFAGLATGSHTVTVEVADETGPGATASYSWLVDAATPRVSADTLPVVSLSPATFRWSGSDVGTGVASYDVRYRRAARDGRFGAWIYPSAWQRTTATSVRHTGARGSTECFAVRARDAAGNVSGWSPRRCTSVPLDDRALTTHNRWGRITNARFYGGTATSTSQTNATLTVTGVSARRLALVVTTCRTCGSVHVYLGGHLIGTVSLRAAHTTRRVVLLTPAFARRSGTLMIQVASSGRTVQVDGLAALP